MTNFCETSISILGFFDDDEGLWSAVALEFDLWGYGETKEEALEELMDGVKVQTGFAEFKENPALLLQPAPAMYYRLYAQAQNELLQAGIRHEKVDSDTFAGGMSLPVIEDNHYAVA